MVAATTELNIDIVIAKNTTGSPVEIEDMGISIDASPGLRTLSESFTQDEITSSDDLLFLVNNGTLTINNGTIDLDTDLAVDYISTNTLSRDPEDPIWNAYKFYNKPIEQVIDPLDDGYAYLWSPAEQEFVLRYVKGTADNYPQVFSLVWTETQAGKKDWLKNNLDDLPVLGHILAFPIKIRDAAIWCESTGGTACQIELYIEDTLIMDIFDIPSGQSNYTDYINELNVLIDPVQRIRARMSEQNGIVMKKFSLNITVERIG
jgi:hypothetical protein